MLIADAKYKFTYIDVGANGRISDGGVFNRSSFFTSLTDNKLHLPAPEPLPGRDEPVPYFLVADDAFALTNNLMKPYALRNLSGLERIFNYRLSRARRNVENAFGILGSRFRVIEAVFISILRWSIATTMKVMLWMVIGAEILIQKIIFTHSKRIALLSATKENKYVTNCLNILFKKEKSAFNIVVFE